MLHASQPLTSVLQLRFCSNSPRQGSPRTHPAQASASLEPRACVLPLLSLQLERASPSGPPPEPQCPLVHVPASPPPAPSL